MKFQECNSTVFLWRVDTAKLIGLKGIGFLERVLAIDEIERSKRFVVEGDRLRFIAGRYFLRRVLGSHCGVGPSQIRFIGGYNGKPLLCPSQSTSGHFSFSRSGDFAACAFFFGGPIGLDIEVTKALADIESVAATIFSATDLSKWNSVPDTERLGFFYRGWTRKEAVGKVDGSGISVGPENIPIPLVNLGDGKSILFESDQVLLMFDWLPFAKTNGSIAISYSGIELPASSGAPLVYADSSESHFDFELTIRRLSVG